MEWFAAMDYGFTHYTVVLLGCTDGDGNVFVVDEHAERLWLPARHAAAIKAMLARHGVSVERLRRFVAGADVFSRQSDGTTIAAQYGRLGIRLRPANTQRVSGWAEILARFGQRVVHHEPISGVFSAALGDYGYLVRSPDLDEVIEMATYIQQVAA